MLELEHLSRRGARPLRFDVAELWLAGFSGRSVELRDAHIEELRELGVEPPAEVPACWSVDPQLASTDTRLKVQGAETSGEVEFALLFADDGTYVALGSDHTDRALEVHSIARAKQVCRKVLSRTVLAVADVQDVWDEIEISAEVREDARWIPYQRATLASILPPDDLIALRFADGRPPVGTVIMSGTVPILDGITRYARQWRCEMVVPGLAESLTLAYSVEALPHS